METIKWSDKNILLLSFKLRQKMEIELKDIGFFTICILIINRIRSSSIPYVSGLEVPKRVPTRPTSCNPLRMTPIVACSLFESHLRFYPDCFTFCVKLDHILFLLVPSHIWLPIQIVPNDIITNTPNSFYFYRLIPRSFQLLSSSWGLIPSFATPNTASQGGRIFIIFSRCAVSLSSPDQVIRYTLSALSRGRILGEYK